MTSFAFILGVVPLAIAHGAGAASQQAIGTGVLFGMMTATVLAIYLVPVFFVVVRSVFNRKKTPSNGNPSSSPSTEDSHKETKSHEQSWKDMLGLLKRNKKDKDDA